MGGEFAGRARRVSALTAEMFCTSALVGAQDASQESERPSPIPAFRV